MSRHKEWRKIAKRERRKRIRRHEALRRWEKEEYERLKREANPIYQQWLKEQESHELFERAELERINNEENEKWLRSELIAQKDWRELQEKISRARMERAQQEIRIKKLIAQKDWRELQEKISRARMERAQQEIRIKKQWLKEQESHELFERAELERINNEENEKWLRSELIAQKDWRELQEKISRARMERAQQEIRIKKEWEREQQKIKEMEEKIKAAEDERHKTQEAFSKSLEDFLSGDGELPEQLQVQWETKPNAELCPFFLKTAACRFGDNCSRNHRNPGVSKVLLASNFYIHFGLENSSTNEYDTDILLEYDDNDTYKHFVEFYEDVLPEFERWGEVVQFKVCINHERHLRGNTYVEFSSLRSAVAAQRALHARWYGGRQITLRFCNIPSWKSAICGMFITRRCPKGRSCNFMHVFRNPRNMFDIRDSSYRQTVKRSPSRDSNFSRDKENKRDWRWSESPEHQVDTRKHKNDDHRYREHARESDNRYRKSNREQTRGISSGSRRSDYKKYNSGRDRSRSRSPSRRKRKKGRSCSREKSRSSHRKRDTPEMS